MSANFDPSAAGKPYVRADQITILFPPPGSTPEHAQVNIHQSQAVTLTDGTAIEYNDLGNIQTTIDVSGDVDLSQITFPLVNITNDTPLGPTGDMQTLFILLVSYVRSVQRAAGINQ